MNQQSFGRRVARLISDPGTSLVRACGRSPLVRRIGARLLNLRAPSPETGTDLEATTLFKDVDAAELAAALERDGFALGLRLPDEVVRQLLAYADSELCWADRDETAGFHLRDLAAAEERLKRRFVTGTYYNASSRCDVIRRIARDPLLMDVARRYLGRSARFLGSTYFWSFAAPSSEESRSTYAQMFHYDMDDFKFMKVFFYLTDVEAESGAHVFVRGTHARKKARHQLIYRRYTDSEIEQAYGDRITMICGRAGEGFVEDTYGLHKGTPPQKSSRLILWFEYGMNDWGFNQHDRRDQRGLRGLEL